jgi:8-oxo-dGTP pyrophosphatase MutT (NUDIX family)
MPMSEYIAALRSRVGNDLLLLPAVTAVIRRGDRFLLARGAGEQSWSLVGGGVEPGEHPAAALIREVTEELGVVPEVHGIVGVYGGPSLMVEYANGDRAAYVTTVYDCTIPDAPLTLELEEIAEVRWMTPDDVTRIDLQPWAAAPLADAIAGGSATGNGSGTLEAEHRR